MVELRQLTRLFLQNVEIVLNSGELLFEKLDLLLLHELGLGKLFQSYFPLLEKPCAFLQLSCHLSLRLFKFLGKEIPFLHELVDLPFLQVKDLSLL